MAKYTVYPGKFVCHTCGAEVKTLRSYPSEKKLTWVCNDKHMTEISLNTKKSKKDYEREG
jgi:hypothetical protein